MFEVSLVYRVSSRMAKATHKNPALKNQKKRMEKRGEGWEGTAQEEKVTLRC